MPNQTVIHLDAPGPKTLVSRLSDLIGNEVPGTKGSQIVESIVSLSVVLKKGHYDLIWHGFAVVNTYVADSDEPPF